MQGLCEGKSSSRFVTLRLRRRVPNTLLLCNGDGTAGPTMVLRARTRPQASSLELELMMHEALSSTIRDWCNHRRFGPAGRQ